MQRATQVLSAFAATGAAGVASFPTKYNEWLSALPSTNFRIQWSVVYVGGTALRYWLTDTTWGALGLSLHLGKWAPSYEWLAFLLLLCGVDSWQFAKKRGSYNPDLATKQNAIDEPLTGATPPGASL